MPSTPQNLGSAPPGGVRAPTGTSAHDPLTYVPNDLSPEAADEMRRNQPDEFVRRSRAAMAAHVEAMVGFLDAGAEVFDYGNSLRAEAVLGGCERAFDYPGFLPAYIRPLFCEGKGPHLAYRPGVPLIWRTLGADYRLPPAGDHT